MKNKRFWLSLFFMFFSRTNNNCYSFVRYVLRLSKRTFNKYKFIWTNKTKLQLLSSSALSFIPLAHISLIQLNQWTRERYLWHVITWCAYDVSLGNLHEVVHVTPMKKWSCYWLHTPDIHTGALYILFYLFLFIRLVNNSTIHQMLWNICTGPYMARN